MSEMYEVARWSDLKVDRPMRVETHGRKLILVRDGQDVHAFGAECPHAGAPLDGGAVCNGRIVCPWHKGSFRVSDGALLEPPALDGLIRYPAQRKDDEVWIGIAPIKAHHENPAADRRIFAIVGAGAAGTCAAAALREGGFAGEIVLIGEEADLPYDRTSLSKFVVAGDMPLADVPLLRDRTFFSDHHIRFEVGAATRLDASNKTIAITNGRTLTYDMALVAPGGRPNALPVPGAELPGVHMLRNMADAAAILADVDVAQRAVIVGNSFIGLEAASALRKRNVEVIVIAPDDIPFARQFGTELGAMFKHLHEANQVKFIKGKVARFEGRMGVETVLTEGRERVPADLVIVGTGIRPATDFIEGIALREDGGISVDAGMRAADGLYAAGDVAAFVLDGASEPVRIEHWRVAQQQARLAANNMLGAQEHYSDVPFFWTYHYGKSFEYLGHAQQWDEIVIDGDPEQQNFIALFVKDKKVVAILACERERETASLIVLMRESLTKEKALEVIHAADERS